jgi:NOL1/NOP2/fmu family ribosome biogenesis protein
MIRDKLVPDHALAMSQLVTPVVQRTELSYEQSIRYLQRKDLHTALAGKGWQMVTYQGHPLGWINALPHRINNYYPKELRILKDGSRSPDSYRV